MFILCESKGGKFLVLCLTHLFINNVCRQNSCIEQIKGYEPILHLNIQTFKGSPNLIVVAMQVQQISY